MQCQSTNCVMHADMLRTHMQLGLGGGKTGLGIRQTWSAVTGGSLGYRALLVGALPRVQSPALGYTVKSSRRAFSASCAVSAIVT